MSSSTNATAIEHMSNGRCFAATAPLEGPPLFVNGNVVFQAHDVGWLVCGIFTLFSCGFSFWLINKHLVNYTNRAEQRYIVRLLFMPPLYAVVSTASFVLWDHSTALLLVRDCYEGVVLVSFFYLLLTYLSPDSIELSNIFRTDGLSKEQDARLIAQGKPPGHWWFPLNKVKWKPADGMYFLQFMKWTVLQYIVVRPLCTLAAVALNYMGLYCEESWSPVWGYVWITVIVSISVSVAMYCLVQLYLCVAPRLAPHHPILKLFSIKAVVFLTFWQASFLSVLATFNAIKDTPYMTAEDIEVGWGAILETFEMCAFALLHIKAFSYKPYVLKASEGDPPPLHTPRLRSLAHAFNFGETMREIRDGWVYMVARMRGRETDTAVRRLAHHEKLFVRSRPEAGVDYVAEPYEKEVAREKDRLEDGYAFDSRGRAIEVGVHRTVEFDRDGEKLSSDYAGHEYHAGRSWWRGIYDRISSSHIDDEPLDAPIDDYPTSDSKWRGAAIQHRNGSRTRNFSRPVRDMYTHTGAAEERVGLVSRELGVRGSRNVREYDDAPPPSLIRGYRAQQEIVQTLSSSSAGERDSIPHHATIARSLDPYEAPHIVTSPPPDTTSQPYSPFRRGAAAQSQSHLNISRPHIPHLDSTTTISTNLGFNGAFGSLPPSSAGHPSLSATASTPSLVPSSAHSGGRQPMIRQVNAGRVVNVALPAPLSPHNEVSTSHAPSPGPSSPPSPPANTPPIISPFKRRSQPHSPAPSAPPPRSPPRARQSLDARTSRSGSTPHGQSLGSPSSYWVHPELANARPIYAAAMQPPASPPRALLPSSPTMQGSSASIVSATDDRSFVTASEGDGALQHGPGSLR